MAAVATGVARRAQTPQFKGDLAVIHERLKDQACPGASGVPAKVHERVSAAAADIARGS